jgi:hypothetical protein
MAPEIILPLTDYPSLEDWRLLALLGKRIISVIKILIHIPLPFLQYLFHAIRAGLRVFIYCCRTRNRNLGETIKFLFSLFKMVIAIVALILCLFTPIPSVLVAMFFIYGVVKLIHSGGVLLFSFAAHLRLDRSLPENKWRQDQHWDNIKKHLSLLAIGIAMTLLTSILMAGVGAVFLAGPVVVLSLVIVCVVTLAAAVYLCGLFYQRRKIGNKDPVLTAEYDANIKKFVKFFGFWSLSLVLIAVPIVIGFVCPGIPLVAYAVAATFLVVFYLIDMGKSAYDHANTTKVAEPAPAGLPPKNSLVDAMEYDYYKRKSRAVYLNPTDSQKNVVFLLKEALVKYMELSRPHCFLERGKIEHKKRGIINAMADLLQSEYSSKDKNELVNVLIEAIEGLNTDKQELENSSEPIKIKKIIDNIADLAKDLDELLNRMTSDNENRENSNNVLITLCEAYTNGPVSTVYPPATAQSFWLKKADFDDFVEACEAAKEFSPSTVKMNTCKQAFSLA